MTCYIKAQKIEYLTMSISFFQGPQAVPDLFQLIIGPLHPTLELQHHTLVLLLLTCMELLQLPVLP